MSIEGYLKSTENKPRTFKNVAGKLLAEKEPEDTRPWRWEDEIGEINWKSGQAALQVYDVNSMQFPYLVASMSSELRNSQLLTIFAIITNSAVRRCC